ncbi:hypothetical protein GUJ93_ZPchr0001g32781 [Zizania palustris]|uniref:HMA domain-containing protein n=1 Tax=Zizania palustris TaxID=103762 RepID=A0A8J5V004_ZIZPA|nr:hypothetical protein GUJ93_ZPchr0001g32781 [Zizania palustris]
MSKNTVIPLVPFARPKSCLLSAMYGSLSIDDDKCQLTVLGAVDPVKLAHKLKKMGIIPTIETVEDDKPKDPPAPEKKKDPCQCQEACVTMCMQSFYCSTYVLPNYYFYKA